MYTVTTKTMKIDGQTKKVFMIRGDEAYARSTDTALSYSNIVSGDIRGVKVDLTVNLYRTIGASTVLIYDGDTVIKSVNVASNQSSVIISNVYLSYVVEHSLQAVYQGNSQCLKSKSKRVALTEPLPSSLATNIEFVDAPTQVATGSDVTLNLYAHIENVAVPDDTPILLYIDSELVGQTVTDGGSATIHTGELDTGLHNIQAVIEQSPTVNRVESDIQISSGVNISYDTVPNVFFNGMNNTVKVRVDDWYGNSVGSATVTFNGESISTTNEGIATFNNITNIVNGQSYTATCNGCSVSRVMNAITVSGVDVKLVQDGVCALNYTEPLTITISGDGYTGAIPVTITDGTNTTTANIVPNTPYPYDYQGMGNGDVTVSATCGAVSDSVQIEDLLCGYKALDYEYNLIMSNNGMTTVTKDGTGILMRFNRTAQLGFYTEEIGTSLEFHIKECQRSTYMQFGLMNGGHYILAGLTAMDKVKIVREDTVLKYYKNDELVHTTQVGNAVLNMWEIKILNYPITEKQDPKIRIDELKIK